MKHAPATPHTPVLLAVAAACVGAALAAWLAFAPLDDVVRGVGRLVPQERTQTIQHLEGGIIAAILVQEGDVVEKGQPLFRIQDQTARTERDEQSIGLAGLQLRQARLQAERDGLPNPAFTDADRATHPDLVKAEQELFTARAGDFRHQLDILHEQARQKQLQADDAAHQAANLQQELATAQKQLDINTKLRQSGALSESVLLSAQAQVQQIQTRLSSAQGQIPVMKAAMAELSRHEDQLRQERLSKIADELSTVNVQIQQYQEREKSLGDRLDRTVVTAPVSGIVNRLLVSTVGGVVKPGDALAELTPTEGGLVVEGKVGARDRARVYNGQKVTVRISAYDYASYGSLTGTIRDISADSFHDDGGNTFYRVTITLPKEQIAGKKLVPGMTADFYVKSDRHSTLWRLALPFRKLFFY